MHNDGKALIAESLRDQQRVDARRRNDLRHMAAARGLLLRKCQPAGFLLIDPVSQENTLVADLDAVTSLLASMQNARELSRAEALAVRSGLARMMGDNRVTARAARIAVAAETASKQEMCEILIVHADDTRELVGHADNVFIESRDVGREYVVLGPSGEEGYELRVGDTLLVAGTMVDPETLRVWEPTSGA